MQNVEDRIDSPFPYPIPVSITARLNQISQNPETLANDLLPFREAGKLRPKWNFSGKFGNRLKRRFCGHERQAADTRNRARGYKGDSPSLN